MYKVSNQAQKPKNAAVIKSNHQTIFSVPKGEKDYNKKYLIFDQITHFNKKGLITQTFQYKSDTLFCYTSYYYDTNNILLSCEEYNSDNSLYLTINYTHNHKGFVTRADYIRSSQKHYDDHRNPVDVEFEKYYKKLYTYIVYINDFMGNVIEAQYYTADNKLSFKYSYRYDFRYNQTEIKYYNNKGSVSWRKKLKYDKEGYLVQYKLYMNNRQALLSKVRYQFDQNNNWINCTETRKRYDNFFAYDVTDNTLFMVRKLDYY
ncbi:MAG: hypothetical protein DRJ09_07140 [Bacteroidetes bacterium]|nr:MAG: hypothetical protein DRJ09_07140 [Bacteroidota bacterium]